MAITMHCICIKPDGGMGGRTPAGAAGIHIRGNTDGRPTPMRNAVSAARGGRGRLG